MHTFTIDEVDLRHSTISTGGANWELPTGPPKHQIVPVVLYMVIKLREELVGILVERPDI